jgi:hypothetical protein
MVTHLITLEHIGKQVLFGQIIMIGMDIVSCTTLSMYLLVFLGNNAHAMSKQLPNRFLDDIFNIFELDQYLQFKPNQIGIESQVVF